jgi:hypothetical protein
MNIGYLIYEAERPKSVAEQRAADLHTGELAASIARLRRSLKDAVMRVTDRTRTGGGAAVAGGARDTSISVANLERLYSAPCARPALGGRGAEGEPTVRSR